MEDTARIRAATTLRSLKRQARLLAESEAPPVGASTRRKAVRSAFVSRQTGRHYARLLAEHVATLERERDDVARANQQAASEVQALRTWLSVHAPAPSFIDDVIEGQGGTTGGLPNG